jgi:hypothetical protein
VEKGFRENVLDGFGSRWAVTESTGLMDARVGCFVGPRLPRRYNEFVARELVQRKNNERFAPLARRANPPSAKASTVNGPYYRQHGTRPIHGFLWPRTSKWLIRMELHQMFDTPFTAEDLQG